MSESTPNETVVVSTVISVAPELAFEIFTDDVDVWWKRGPRFRSPDDAVMRFEPGPSGRLVADDARGGTREIGQVLAWEPDAGRLVFEFRATNFTPDEVTEVEVLFEPVEGGTRVTLEHRGLDVLRRDHPARHGLEGAALVSLYGLWWADLLIGVRERTPATGR